MNQGRVLVFARAPVPGKAKTRLIPALGAEAAARLHARLVHQTLDTACALDNAVVELWCSPDSTADFFQACSARYSLELHTQTGGDLGERMHQALCQALQKSPWALLIGTDIPHLRTEDLRQAREHLLDCDAVMGPAEDGGYYLLGLKDAAKELFAEMPWSTDQVGALTRKRLDKLGWEHVDIRTLNDLDRPEDLALFEELAHHRAI